jgi:hypothetical protein
MSSLPLLHRRLAPIAAWVAGLTLLAGCGGGGGGSEPSTLEAIVHIQDKTLSETGGLQYAVLTMLNPTGVTCRLKVTTADGTAVAGADYTAVDREVVMTGGSMELTLNTLDDDLVEGDETFTVTIALSAGSDPQCRISAGVATITIESEDVPSVLSIADATIGEATGGTAMVSMTNPAAGRNCAVIVRTADGTAVAGGDYVAIDGGRLELGAASSAPLQLTTLNDAAPEADEIFTVGISLAEGVDPRCQIGDGEAVVTIVSDE